MSTPRTTLSASSRLIRSHLQPSSRLLSTSSPSRPFHLSCSFSLEKVRNSQAQSRRFLSSSSSQLVSTTRTRLHPNSTSSSLPELTIEYGSSPTLSPSPAPNQTPAPTGVEVPQVSHDDTEINIGWMDGKWSRFNNRFLFDHCRCPKCMHPVTKQRLKQLVDIPKDIKGVELSPIPEGLNVIWSTPDQHASFYPWSFLHRASYDPPLEDVRASSDDKILWNASIAKSPPTVEYATLIPSETVTEEQAERAVLRWLTKIDEFGFCFVSGVPVSTEATEQLIRRIAAIRETHYGAFWDFTADLKHGDMAYTNEALPAHTDNTYFTDPAGLQCFHLLSHPAPGKGGETLLVDAFYAASILNQLHPSAYQVLSRLRFPSHASGTPDTLLRPLSQPVLTHDGVTGELVQVRWNNEDRGVLGHGWTPDEVEAWYDAALKWEESSRSADAEYWVQLSPGTMVVIDNWRVMHGRSAFTGQRRMCGAYVGYDDWRSRLETLKRKFDDHAVKSPEAAVWEVGW